MVVETNVTWLMGLHSFADNYYARMLVLSTATVLELLSATSMHHGRGASAGRGGVELGD